MKTIVLLDYRNWPCEIYVDDFDHVTLISLMVISGDEIAKVYYEDGTIEKYDSSTSRCMSAYDGEYIIYNKSIGFSLLDEEAWVHRKSSYSYMSEVINNDL